MTAMLESIERLVREALAKGSGEEGRGLLHELTCAMRSDPQLTVVDELTLRCGEYQISVGIPLHVEAQVTQLERARELNVTSAPEVVAVIPAGRDHRVLVIRYLLPAGEEVLDFEETDFMPSEAAQNALLDDLRKLATAGMTNPYARGTFHWLIGSESRRLFLNDWSAMRACSAAEGEENLERVARAFERVRKQCESSRLRRVFGTSRVLLPVVHPVGKEEALKSVAVAVAAGCKGVWLINQGMSEVEVMQLVLEVRQIHPKLWVGLNLLGHSPAEALEMALEGCGGRIDGLWTDNAGVDERKEEQARAQEFVSARQRLGWDGLYFGGVAFKYQREVAAADLPNATRLGTRFMDVVCTSGPGTGQQARAEKVAMMRKAMGHGGALALASGVTAENVHEFLPHVNAFLVGTGIEEAFGVLDAAKVDALQAKITAYGEQG